MSDIAERYSNSPESESRSSALSPFLGIDRLNQKLLEKEPPVRNTTNPQPLPFDPFKPAPAGDKTKPQPLPFDPFKPAPGGDKTTPQPLPFDPFRPAPAGDKTTPQPLPFDPFRPAPGGEKTNPQPLPFDPFRMPRPSDNTRPQPDRQQPPAFPDLVPDNRHRPVEPSPGPIYIPPISDNPNRPSEKPAAIRPGPDGRIEVTERDFDKIGPKAKEVLQQAGVTKLTITPGRGFDTYEAELKKPLEIPQDPNEDGVRKLKMDTHFRADVKRGADGSLMLDNIQGLTAESKIVFRFREVEVQKISLRQTPDGKSEITSTGSFNGMSGTKTRIQPGEVFDKANILFNRMQNIKGGGYIDVPPLPGR